MSQEVVMVQASRARMWFSVMGFALVVVLIMVLGWYLKQLKDDNQKLRTEVTEFKVLTDTLVRSSTHWATKDDLDTSLKNLLTKDDFKALQKDIDGLKASLVAVGQTVGSLGRKVSSLERSDREGPANPTTVACADGRLIDVHGYTKAPQTKDMTDSNSAPLASVTFDAAKDKPWGYDVFERKYRIVTAVGKQDSGQMTFHHTLDYTVPGKSIENYKISLLTSEYLQVPPSRKMFWWNPILDIGPFVGGTFLKYAMWDMGRPDSVLSVGADLGLSFSSYGETRVDSLWRFFRVGLGYDAERRSGRLSFTPVLFNLGNPMPLITNLWLGPYISADSAGGLGAGLGITLQL